MLRLLTDEDFNGRIVRGLWLRKSDLDLLRVQDIGLSGENDPSILDWAERYNVPIQSPNCSAIRDYSCVFSTLVTPKVE